MPKTISNRIWLSSTSCFSWDHVLLKTECLFSWRENSSQLHFAAFARVASFHWDFPFARVELFHWGFSFARVFEGIPVARAMCFLCGSAFARVFEGIPVARAMCFLCGSAFARVAKLVKWGFSFARVQLASCSFPFARVAPFSGGSPFARAARNHSINIFKGTCSLDSDRRCLSLFSDLILVLFDVVLHTCSNAA